METAPESTLAFEGALMGALSPYSKSDSPKKKINAEGLDG
jgi:hypothetical protein